MSHPIYAAPQLLGKKRPQLWQICRSLNLPCYPSSSKCVAAILEHPSQQAERIEIEAQQVLDSADERQPHEAAISFTATCSDCSCFQPYEGEQRGYCKLWDKVAKSFWERTPSCDEADESPQAELNQLIETQAQEIAPEYTTEGVKVAAVCTSAGYPTQEEDIKAIRIDGEQWSIQLIRGEPIQLNKSHFVVASAEAKAALLQFERHGNQLFVINAEQRSYPMSLDGSWCGCMGNRSHGHCYHKDEFQRRKQIAERLPEGAMKLPARLLKAGDVVWMDDQSWKVHSVSSARLASAWAGFMGLKIQLVPVDFRQLPHPASPQSSEKAEWDAYWQSRDKRLSHLKANIRAEVCRAEAEWVVFVEDQLPF